MTTLGDIYKATFEKEASMDKESAKGKLLARLGKKLTEGKKTVSDAAKKGGKAVGKGVEAVKKFVKKHKGATAAGAGAAAAAGGYGAYRAMKKKSSDETAQPTSLKELYEASFQKEAAAAAAEAKAPVEKVADDDIMAELDNLSEQELYEVADELGITEDEVAKATETTTEEAPASEEAAPAADEKTSSDEVEKTAEELYYGGRIFAQGFLSAISEKENGQEKKASEEKKASDVEALKPLIAQKLQASKE